MTISSHPWLKLLVGIIAAIFAGIISSSWGWGLATFAILMFIFIWVASWIFGGRFKGKVEVNDELEELLYKLKRIGSLKNAVPFDARGWCNSLGLYVQLRQTGDAARLQAGGKLESRIDAWCGDVYQSTGVEWKVKKYDPGDWEKLVDPTREIAEWLFEHEGLPSEYRDSFTGAIEVFKKDDQLKLPDMRTHKTIKYIAGPLISEDMLREVGHHIMFEEETRVTIDNTEELIPAGTTFRQAYDHSTNGIWRNKVRMALMKETARGKEQA
ncbi:MAG: hypothetical protein A2158_07130 [Chloroflexi bacterium RBG_13_46_14]|nr:MAG: hypothetical protein A2158_07130 [Chloroflexi bacterium RBG_13_46_14]